MFAWILNTKPVNGRSVGSTTRIVASRRGRPLDQRLQDFLYAEVVDRRAEEHRRLPADEERVEIERMARAADQRDIVTQRCRLLGEERVEAAIIEAFDELHVGAHALFAGREAHQPVAAQIEDAAKPLAHPERPRDRRAIDVQH